MMTRTEINETMQAQVCAGTFDPNKYSKGEYRNAGVYLDKHFFAKDEFTMFDEKNGYMKLTYNRQISLSNISELSILYQLEHRLWLSNINKNERRKNKCLS